MGYIQSKSDEYSYLQTSEKSSSQDIPIDFSNKYVFLLFISICLYI